MKKVIALLTAVIMLCSMSATMAEEAYWSIQDIRETAPVRWEKTFETEWRDVESGADIVVPEIETLPVVRIAGGATRPTITAEEAGWDRIEYRGAYDLILANDECEYPKSVDGVRVAGPDSEGSWYGDFDPQNTYVPMHGITLGEILSMAQEKVALLGYDPDDFDWENLIQIWSHHIYAAGTKKDILPGYIFMRVSPKIAGVPVVSHIFKSAVGQSTRRNDEFSMMPEANIGYDGYTDEFTHIMLSPIKVEETLAQDVPLCSFDKVLAAVEKEIEAGHVRKVYEIKLGYVLYNPPGVYRTKGMSPAEKEAMHEAMTYYAKPMWQVNCLYAKSPRGELEDVSYYTDDERNSNDYEQLLIDAQTGELVKASDAKDRCEFKGFLSWDDVR